VAWALSGMKGDCRTVTQCSIHSCIEQGQRKAHHQPHASHTNDKIVTWSTGRRIKVYIIPQTSHSHLHVHILVGQLKRGLLFTEQNHWQEILSSTCTHISSLKQSDIHGTFRFQLICIAPGIPTSGFWPRSPNTFTSFSCPETIVDLHHSCCMIFRYIETRMPYRVHTRIRYVYCPNLARNSIALRIVNIDSYFSV
jgi:hypothetical protein